MDVRGRRWAGSRRERACRSTSERRRRVRVQFVKGREGVWKRHGRAWEAREEEVEDDEYNLRVTEKSRDRQWTERRGSKYKFSSCCGRGEKETGRDMEGGEDTEEEEEEEGEQNMKTDRGRQLRKDSGQNSIQKGLETEVKARIGDS